jgi:hypothetical protein
LAGAESKSPESYAWLGSVYKFPERADVQIDAASHSALGDFHQLGKSFAIVPGKVSQGLAVDLDIGFVKAIDKLAVGHIVQAAGRVDADDPEFAKFSFLLFAMSKGKGHTAFHSLTGGTIDGTATTKKAAGGQHIFFSSAMGSYIIG